MSSGGVNTTQVTAGVLAGAALGFAVASLCKCGKSAQATKKAEPSESIRIYETDNSNNQYMEFHFTPGADAFSPRAIGDISEAFDFPLRIARGFNPFVDTLRAARGNGKSIRVLDLGCATGASSFELSKTFDEVIGIDLSAAFITSAQKMKVEGVLKYKAADQGHISISRTALIDKEANPDRCKFLVGDALNVDPAVGTFDALLAANLLCRVPKPRELLKSFARLINTDGLLFLISPYSWWEGATEVSEWIGGTPGQPRSEEQVKAFLAPFFELVEEKDVPFMIRDHSRRFQLGFSHGTIWRRKNTPAPAPGQ